MILAVLKMSFKKLALLQQRSDSVILAIYLPKCFRPTDSAIDSK